MRFNVKALLVAITVLAVIMFFATRPEPPIARLWGQELISHENALERLTEYQLPVRLTNYLPFTDGGSLWFRLEDKAGKILLIYWDRSFADDDLWSRNDRIYIAVTTVTTDQQPLQERELECFDGDGNSELSAVLQPLLDNAASSPMPEGMSDNWVFHFNLCIKRILAGKSLSGIEYQ